jgi:micrococcal nuclease
MTCNVISVTDGDTFKCRLSKGKEEIIRLIGVDTPESEKNEKAKRDAERSGQDLGTIVSSGKKAANFTKSYLKQGTTVKLELDVQPMDKYGRILAYAYLPDGTMINALLVQEGYAQVMTVPPNVKYQNMFLKLQREARENNRGLWKQ